MLNINQN